MRPDNLEVMVDIHLFQKISARCHPKSQGNRTDVLIIKLPNIFRVLLNILQIPRNHQHKEIKNRRFLLFYFFITLYFL